MTLWTVVSDRVARIPLHKRLLTIGAIVFGLVMLGGFTTVGADESCLLVRNGKIKSDWGNGLHWRFPLMSDVACYRTARTTYEASPGQKGGGAEFNDDPVEAHTSDGQKIDVLGFRIAFHLPLVMTNPDGNATNENNLRRIYTEVGARDTQDLVTSVISFYARPEVRAVVQMHSSDDLLQGDLSVISQEIEDRLRSRYATRGIVLDDVLLSKPDFNDAFEARLQQQQQAEADIEVERRRALQAKQQGEARINTANADATVSAIQQRSTGEQAVNQANVNATVVSIDAQANGNRTVAQANAESTAIAGQIAAYGGAENYLHAQEVAAMSGWPVQILGDSDALPVVQVVLVTPTPAP